MWGGNVFGMTNCVDTDTVESDALTQACSDYIFYEDCGNYDDDDFVASSLCCICGGGANAATVVAEWTSPVQNEATMFATDGEISDLGDRDTYVIYPT